MRGGEAVPAPSADVFALGRRRPRASLHVAPHAGARIETQRPPAASATVRALPTGLPRPKRPLAGLVGPLATAAGQPRGQGGTASAHLDADTITCPAAPGLSLRRVGAAGCGKGAAVTAGAFAADGPVSTICLPACQGAARAWAKSPDRACTVPPPGQVARVKTYADCKRRGENEQRHGARRRPGSQGHQSGSASLGGDDTAKPIDEAAAARNQAGAAKQQRDERQRRQQVG